MAYVSFMSDEHLEKCIETLFNKYEKTKKKFTEKEFYKNQVDPIKLLFDTSFFGTTDEQKILEEIQRKIDKTISNAIGEFHEDLIGGIKGYKKHPVGKGFDITDEKGEKLFADIKNKHNTVTGTHLSNLYVKLEGYIKGKDEAKSYWVQIISSGSSFEEPWIYETKDKKKIYQNPNVYKVSADRFYEILTGNPNAFSELCEALPYAIKNFLEGKIIKPISDKNSEVYDIIKKKAEDNDISFINQIMNDTFGSYNGFPIGKNNIIKKSIELKDLEESINEYEDLFFEREVVEESESKEYLNLISLDYIHIPELNINIHEYQTWTNYSEEMEDYESVELSYYIFNCETNEEIGWSYEDILSTILHLRIDNYTDAKNIKCDIVRGKKAKELSCFSY